VRKYLAIVLCMLFILSFAVVAFAETEVTLGGTILVRGWYFENVGNHSITFDPDGPGPIPARTETYDNLPVNTRSQALYTTDANITIDAKVSDNVRGFMELETTTGEQGGNTSLYYWGNYDTKPASELFFRQLWIQYTGSGLLGVPSGLKVGHMPVTLGEKQFLNNERFGDDAIVLWVDPTKELHLTATTLKIYEGNPDLGSIESWDDVDAYILLGTYNINKDNTVGANWTWIHSDGFAPSLPTLTTNNPNIDKLNFHNIGLHANGKISGLTYAAEADLQFGWLDLLNGVEQKFRGYGLFAKAGYMLDPVNLRASVAYGSGDDQPNDNNIDEFQTLQGPDAIGPLERWVHYTQIYERTIRTTSRESYFTTTEGGNTRNTGIANTTYFNLGFDVTPVKELTLSLDGFLLYASEVEHGSKTAGQELDFKGTYKLAKNLDYFVEAGAFWPGNYYEDTYGIDKKTAAQVIHGICLTF
jgi:hypothetical protein